ncbi:MAG: hypothetical protein IKR97_00450 [Eubacterium sp.]|nr:hypothetical protein [Eubacterium sp.]
MKKIIMRFICLIVSVILLFSACSIKDLSFSSKDLKGTPYSICNGTRRIWYLIERNSEETLIPLAYCVAEKGKMMYFPYLTRDISLYDYSKMTDDEIIEKLYKIRKDKYIDLVRQRGGTEKTKIDKYKEPEYAPINYELVKDDSTGEIVQERLYADIERLTYDLSNYSKFEFEPIPTELIFIRQGEYTVNMNEKQFCGYQTVSTDSFDSKEYYWLTCVDNESTVKLELDKENNNSIKTVPYQIKNEYYYNNEIYNNKNILF